MAETLKKQERLCSETAIETLFKKGRKVSAYPIVAVSCKRDDSDAARILISVAKKRFHTAVQRNLLKRRVRVAYRTSEKFPAGYDVALIYIGNGDESVERIASALMAIKQKLVTPQP